MPLDYKGYINAFGTGCLDDFIWVLNPFSSNRYLSLFSQGEAALQALRELQSDFGFEVPHPLFPEPGGLLPWGTTDNGDVLYWLTEGRPDDWPVVANAARGPEVERYAMGMSAFLAKVLTREIVSGILPDDFPGEEHSFRVS